MEEKYDVTIIIPVYNVEKYIQRCLESVISQDCIDVKLECLIIDDCGQDKSMDIVHDIVDNYKGHIRFELIKHEQNRGLSAARNTGILRAKGEYIMFIDSDDYILLGSIKRFVNSISLYPECDLVVGNVKDWNGNLRIQGLDKETLIQDRNTFFLQMLHQKIHVNAWNKMVRRKVLIENNLFFIDGILFEDVAWTYLMFLKLNNVLLLPDETYSYEQNQNSIMGTMFAPERAEKVLKSFTITCNVLLENSPSSFGLKQYAIVDYLLYIAGYLHKGVAVFLCNPVSEEIRKSFESVRLHLLMRSLSCYRFLLALFFLLLFPPLCYIQKVRLFRRNYYKIEKAICLVAHFTDFLHDKDE